MIPKVFFLNSQTLHFCVSKGQKRGKTSFIVKIVVCSEECPAVICGKGAPEQIFVGIKRCNLAKLVEIFVSGVMYFVLFSDIQCCLHTAMQFSHNVNIESGRQQIYQLLQNSAFQFNLTKHFLKEASKSPQKLTNLELTSCSPSAYVMIFQLSRKML